MQRMRPGDVAINVIPQRMAVPHVQPPPPPVRWLFASTLAFASLLAVLAGLPLGFLAATDLVVDLRWTEAVQAHGRLQLFAWAAPIVVALAFEFLPRLNDRPFLPAWPRIAVLGLLVAGALVQATALLFRISSLMLPGTLLVLAAAVVFLVLVLILRYRGSYAANPQALYFPVAAIWLVAASVAAAVSEIRVDAQIVPLDDSRLLAELFLRGFILHAVIGIGLRAFPGHLGLPVVPAARQWLMLAALSGSAAVWAAGSGGVDLPDSETVRRIGDVALAVTVLAATRWKAMFASPRSWFGGPVYTLLVRVAWAGLAVYALTIGLVALLGSPGDLSLWQGGAIRHIFVLGFLAPLILAMAHIVLARFGVGHVPGERWLAIAFVVTVAAVPLRVVPGVARDAPDDASRALLGAAGVLAIVAFSLAAAVFARSALLIRRSG